MAIIYDPTIIESFFGTAGEMNDPEVTAHQTLWISYVGPVLKYTIFLDLECEMVGVSGDIVLPFGGDSMYEIYVPCSEITADEFEEGKVCLS